MKKIIIEIKWALLFFIMGLMWMVFEKSMGLHSTHIDQQPYAALVFILPATAIYIMALLEKRKIDFHGSITYKQALLSGLLLTLFVAILSPLSQFISSRYISPDYFENMRAYSVKIGHFSSLVRAEEYYNLENYLVQSVVGAVVMGIIISLLVAAFVKNKKAAPSTKKNP